MRLALLLLVAFAAAVGCRPPEVNPQDFIGTWRTVDANDGGMVLELRADGTFVRRSQYGGVTIEEGGSYKVATNLITFTAEIESVQNREPLTSKAVFKTPYRLEGQILVLDPGTPRERKFMMLEDPRTRIRKPSPESQSSR